MPEYTTYERTRKDKNGKEVKQLKVKRFRGSIILNKMGKEQILKKSTDMKFGEHIKKLGHVFAKSKRDAIMQVLMNSFKKKE